MIKLWCSAYEVTLEIVKEKLQSNSKKADGAVREGKLQELMTEKKESERQKASFKDIVKQQSHDNMKQAVIKVIKEKEELVRDAVDKKCIVILN